jgi:putative multiple sugar transport system permease protein
MVVLEGRTFSPFPKEYTWIAAGFLPQARFGQFDLIAIGFGVLCVALLLFYQIKERMKAIKYGEKVENKYLFLIKMVFISFAIVFVSYWLGTHNGLPGIFILLILLVLFYTFLTNKTVIGRRVYAFGGNEKAAKLSGINTNKVLFLTFVNMGLVAAIAGIVFSGRLNAATPNAGVGFELDAIAACYIGGASASGGTGKIIGAVIGGLVMGILNNGMSILGVGIDWQQAIKGLVLLLAVAIDIVSRKKQA